MIATVCLLKPHLGPDLSPFINNMTGALLINPFNLHNKITDFLKETINIQKELFQNKSYSPQKFKSPVTMAVLCVLEAENRVL